MLVWVCYVCAVCVLCGCCVCPVCVLSGACVCACPCSCLGRDLPGRGPEYRCISFCMRAVLCI